MNFNDIKTWLAETERNEFFFQREENGKALAEDRVRFKEAHRALREHLELHELKGTLTREAYLEWVKLWKATYAKLSYESRMAKKYRKASVVGETLATINHNTVGYLCWYASSFLGLRNLSKLAANKAWLKEKAKAVEPA